MAQKPFGGAHTEAKLEKLEAYLHAYTTALQRKPFKLVYFDAFAGTGGIPIENENDQLRFDSVHYKPFIEGSARRALRLNVPFHEYVFVEKSRTKARELEHLRAEFPSLADRIRIENKDANEALKSFCRETNWRNCRAVVFLDPFGNQVLWDTMETIANCEGIDLWYLFPAGLGVDRQIARDGRVHFTHEESLDRLFGVKEWRTQFIEENVREDLFGAMVESQKTATPSSITKFMIKRMQKEFHGGVLEEWLPLGSRKIHMYSLLFAWTNPSPAAQRLAAKLALAVLKGSKRGRTKRN